MSDDYLNLTVRSRPNEDEAAFKSRLSEFWTHMLRNFPDDFERVYAESAAFDRDSDALTRQYLIESVAIGRVESEMQSAGIGHAPIDRDDVYSKYEATPPDWMWIEH